MIIMICSGLEYDLEIYADTVIGGCFVVFPPFLFGNGCITKKKVISPALQGSCRRCQASAEMRRPRSESNRYRTMAVDNLI